MNDKGTIEYIRRLQSSLARVYIARQLFEQAWPEVLGNQPEYSELPNRIMDDLDEVTKINLDKINKEIEQMTVTK